MLSWLLKYMNWSPNLPEVTAIWSDRKWKKIWTGSRKIYFWKACKKLFRESYSRFLISYPFIPRRESFFSLMSSRITLTHESSRTSWPSWRFRLYRRWRGRNDQGHPSRIGEVEIHHHMYRDCPQRHKSSVHEEWHDNQRQCCKELQGYATGNVPYDECNWDTV